MDGKEELLKERSKTRLKKEVKKRIQTTMIGALSSIEKHLGSLWGNDTDNPTPEQAVMKEVFEELRTEILDKGNNQIRNIDSEIETYDIVWNKYHYSLPLKPFNG
tara:strand:- start:1227 stop:1541 length:315 start_codon:yes stop_codon:yes gene_type:complete